MECDRTGIEAMIAGIRQQAVDVLGADAESKLKADTEANYARLRAGRQ